MTFFTCSDKVLRAAETAEQICVPVFRQIEETLQYNSQKVLHAFISHKVGAMHLLGTNGYGYDDVGRDKIDEVFSAITGSEDALVRYSFVNGTHAISTALFGVLRPGDTLLSVTGQPYDTLASVISGSSGGSLREFGVRYEEIALLPDGTVNLPEIAQKAKTCKVAYIQRSRGYSLRPSLSIQSIQTLVSAIRSANPNAIIMVDNCYGEFCETAEPTDVGADLIIGSLIKNPGGGIAQTGGYIAGKKEWIALCANRLTTVGTGKEVGCTLTQNREILLGLFHAPLTVAEALKTSVFATALFTALGYKTYPRADEQRTDIIAAIELGSPEALCAFCRGIQAGSPIDSYVTPEPWAMPGYDSEVIMAAGAFTMGASIELSADAPLRPPYAVWLQGGLTYATGKTGIMLAADSIANG